MRAHSAPISAACQSGFVGHSESVRENRKREERRKPLQCHHHLRLEIIQISTLCVYVTTYKAKRGGKGGKDHIGE
jgi:hypothetical protein